MTFQLFNSKLYWFDDYQNEDNIMTEEFINISCSKCSNNFSFIICIYCSEKIMMKIHPLSNIIKYNGINGLNIKCPYKSCNKIFYFSECPKCHSTNTQCLKRVTGYLTGDYKTAFNEGKQQEAEMRVKHCGIEA